MDEKHKNYLDYLIVFLACTMAIFHMAYSQVQIVPSLLEQNIHLGLALVLALLGLYKTSTSRSSKLVILCLLLLGIFCSLYIQIRYDDLLGFQGFPDELSVVVGIVFIIVVLETSRRTWGMILPTLSAIAILYFAFGHLLKGTIAHTYIPFDSVISTLSVGLHGGLYGTFMNISANFIFLFLLFGGLLASLGATNFFLELGKLIGKYVPGGSAQTTIVSNGLMGMVMGDAVSSVSVTGPFTIPLMKEDGYGKITSGAILATAATGAQIMPPVMGSVSFIMAVFIGVPYIEIAKVAVIPAVLFYSSLFTYVYLNAKKVGTKNKLSAHSGPKILYFAPLFVIPVGFLIYLLVARYSVMFAAFYTICVLIGMRFLMIILAPLLPERLRGLDSQAMGNIRENTGSFLKNLIDGFTQGALIGSKIAIILGTIGLLAQSIITTGIGAKFGIIVSMVAGENIFFVLLLTAIVTLILGCGLPTVAAYVLVNAIIAPTLVQYGLSEMVANFFILYYAVLSAVTPPVATAALTASSLTGGHFFKTGLQATKISTCLYFIPFLFAYNPVVLGIGAESYTQVVVLFIEMLLFCVLIAIVLQRYFLTNVNIFEFIIAIIAILSFAFHVAQGNSTFLFVALGSSLVVLISQLVKRKKSIKRVEVVS